MGYLAIQLGFLGIQDRYNGVLIIVVFWAV
jgi:hypothetical protein